MRYTVTWLPDAEEELADLWLRASDRSAVTRAAHGLERRLRIDPLDTGEARADDVRIAFMPPLGILFRVLLDDCRVEVIHVWDTDQP
jgi:hypothetical protein